MAMKALFIIVQPELAIDVIRSASDRAWEIHGMCRSCNNHNIIRFSRKCHKFTKIDSDIFDQADKGDLINIIHSYCDQEGIDIIIPTDLAATMFLSKHKADFSKYRLFPLPDFDILNVVHNKWNFYRFLEQNDLPTPKTQLLESKDDIDKLSIDFPLMVKPLALSFSRGVVRMDSKDQLVSYLSTSEEFNELPLLLQEFIPGRDIDLNLLAYEGELIGHSVQLWLPDGGLQFVDNAVISRLGKMVVEKLPYHGIAHFDLRIDDRDGSVKFLECNPRFWASLVASKYNGINFAKVGIPLAMGFPNLERMENRKIQYYKGKLLFKNIIQGNLSILSRSSSASFRELANRALDPIATLVKKYSTP